MRPNFSDLTLLERLSNKFYILGSDLDEARTEGNSAVETRAADQDLRSETLADARSRRQQRIRFLRVGEGQHRRLADKLGSCEKGHRCKSEADPVCAALFWQKLHRAVGAILAGRAWTRAAIVTAGLSKPYGHLCEFDLTRAIERLRKRLALSSLRDRIIVGAIDVSLNLKDRKIIGWQLYLDLLVEGENCRRLQAAIEAAFPAEPTAARPYLFKDVADPENAFAHLYKVKFFRRSRYRAKKETRMAKLPLTASDLQELLSFLGRYPVGARLLLNGVNRDDKLPAKHPKRLAGEPVSVRS